jgi:hypothetical protein
MPCRPSRRSAGMSRARQSAPKSMANQNAPRVANAHEDGQTASVGSGPFLGVQDVRRGWRFFECHECANKWERPSRDRHSPSGEDCPRCGEWVAPYANRPDPSLPCDSVGNLLVPWNHSPNKKDEQRPSSGH